MSIYDGASYGPGNMNDVGVAYGWEPYVAPASGGSPSWGGIGAGLLGLADTYLRTDAAIKMQRNADGARYYEGQPVRNQAMQMSIPTSWMLIGGLAALVFLAKD